MVGKYINCMQILLTLTLIWLEKLPLNNLFKKAQLNYKISPSKHHRKVLNPCCKTKITIHKKHKLTNQKLTLLFFKGHFEDCGNCSVVKSVYRSPRGPSLFPITHSWWLTATCNSNSRRANVFFWPSQAPALLDTYHPPHTHTQSMWPLLKQEDLQYYRKIFPK